MAGGGGGGGQINVKGGKHTSKIRKRQGADTGLMITAMLDILTSILFFLMKNYSTVQSDFAKAKDINLPYSSSITPPKPALNLVVTQTAILLDDQPIATIVNGDIAKTDLYRDGVLIVPLAQELKKQKDRSLYIQNNSDNHSFTGTIVLQADKTLQFNVLKKVIYTAGISDFVMMKLAVLKKDEG